MSKNIYNGVCPKCHSEFTKEIKWGHIPKFCSRRCSNSRGPLSDKRKKQNSEYAKRNPRGFAAPDKLYGNAIRNPEKYKTAECPTCHSLFETYKKDPRKFCSSKCVRTGGYRKESFRYGIKGYYRGIHCDSTWELAFLIFHLDHNHKITRHPIVLSYQNQNGDTRKYYPDFEVEGTLFEIKGRVTENDRLKLAANPEVSLLTREELKPIFDYIKLKYQTDFGSFKNLYDSID